MTEQRVIITIEHQIATVILNRAEKHNALDMPMFKSLDAAIKSLKKDRTIRCIIIEGAGEDFCSGLDTKAVMKNISHGIKLLWKWLPGSANLAQRVTVGWRAVPVPVIAVIQGRCWGGGLQIALGADMRIASDNASFSIMEAKWGLLPDMGGTLALREHLSIDKALELAWSAKVIDSHEALQLGLISAVESEPMVAAKKIAASFVRNSPDAIAAIKKLYHKSWVNNQAQILRGETGSQWKVLSGKNRLQSVKKATSEPNASFFNRMKW